MLERLAGDKHTSLLGMLVIYGRKKSYKVGIRVYFHKTVFVEGKIFQVSLIFGGGVK